MLTTPTGVPYPEATDPNDYPADMQALAVHVDELGDWESFTPELTGVTGVTTGPFGRYQLRGRTLTVQVTAYVQQSGTPGTIHATVPFAVSANPGAGVSWMLGMAVLQKGSLITTGWVSRSPMAGSPRVMATFPTDAPLPGTEGLVSLYAEYERVI